MDVLELIFSHPLIVISFVLLLLFAIIGVIGIIRIFWKIHIRRNENKKIN